MDTACSVVEPRDRIVYMNAAAERIQDGDDTQPQCKQLRCSVLAASDDAIKVRLRSAGDRPNVHDGQEYYESGCPGVRRTGWP